MSVRFIGWSSDEGECRPCSVSGLSFDLICVELWLFTFERLVYSKKKFVDTYEVRGRQEAGLDIHRAISGRADYRK